MKKIIALVLALVLLVAPSVRPAEATGGATIGVIGGAIGTGGAAGGLAGGALLLPVLGVVGATLLAFGVDAYVSSAASDAGMTKTAFIQQHLERFALERGSTLVTVAQAFAEGTRVSSGGNIFLNTATALVARQFIDWLFDSGSVYSSVPQGDVYFGPTKVHLIPAGYTRYATGYNAYIWCNTPCYFSVISNPSSASSFYIYLASVNGGSFKSGVSTSSSWPPSYPEGTGGSSIASNGVAYRSVLVNVGSAVVNSLLYPLQAYVSPAAWTRAYVDDFRSEASDSVFVGSQQSWDDNKDLLSPGEGQVVSLNPDLLNPVIDSAAAGDYTVSVPDYLSAIARSLDRVASAEVSIPATNVATGLASTLAVPDTAIANPAVSSASDASPDVVGAGALADPALTITPSDAVPALQFNLTEIFPFCIPFDLVDMITLLSADPVTPRFHMAWTFPIINAPVEFDVDLSQFDGIAAIVRPFELLIFVIGLALVTRDLIRG